MPIISTQNDIKLRKHSAEDLEFMRSLYASTRIRELAMTNLTEQEKAQFISQQFQAQYFHYTQHYDTNAFYIVEMAGEPVGRFFIDYWQNEIRIVDITIAEAHRNSGLATLLLRQLCEEARLRRQPVTIHVEQYNPAKRLYERLGFTFKSQTNSVYLLMEWRADFSAQ